MSWDFLQSTHTFDPVGLAIGLALLVAGRRLYWLALGAAGFLFGVTVAHQLPAFSSEAAGLAVGMLCGLAGIVLALVAQKLAVTVGGIVIGGIGALWLVQPWQAQLGPWIWAVILVGALVGSGFASLVFDLALTVLTCVIGAMIAAGALVLADAHRPLAFVGFLVLGFIIQTRRGRRPKI